MDRPQRHVLPSGAVSLANERGSATVRAVAPRSVELCFQGYVDGPNVVAVIAELDALIRDESGIRIFGDATAVTGYDLSVRLKAAEWLGRMGERVAAMHILQGSRAVALGAAVLGLAIGSKVQVHASRATFDEARAAAAVPIVKPREAG